MASLIYVQNSHFYRLCTDIYRTRFQEFTFWNSAGATSCTPKIVNSVKMDFGVCISLNGRDAKF